MRQREKGRVVYERKPRVESTSGIGKALVFGSYPMPKPGARAGFCGHCVQNKVSKQKRATVGEVDL